MIAMSADPKQSRPTGDPDRPSPVPRAVSGLLILASIFVIFGFSAITGREPALPEQLNIAIIAIIALGALAGLIHMFGIVPANQRLRAFVSPVVAWPVMVAATASLITS